MDTNATPNAAQPKSRRRWYQFGLRTLLLAVTAIGLFLGITTALYRWGEGMAMKIERNAARERVLRTGGAMEYDRRLLGDEADALRAQHQQRITQSTK